MFTVDKKSLALHFLILFLVCSFTTIIFALTANHMKKVEAAFENYENLLYMKLKSGVVVIELMPNVAPNHVARIKKLSRDGFYNGLTFHRVIEGFMAQTGDPKGDGTGGSGTKLKAEFSDVHHIRGVVSMARAQSEDSADSQFFIVLKDSTFLDKKYTVFGRVIAGMEFVDEIKKGDPTQNGSVTNPDKIISLAVASDVEKHKGGH